MGCLPATWPRRELPDGVTLDRGGVGASEGMVAPLSLQGDHPKMFC